MAELSRRELLQAAAVGGVFVAAGEIDAQQRATGSMTDFHHQPVPLPFDAKSLRGLSERLVASHWENNYIGAVKALNVVRDKLRQALATDEPPYLYNDLKREHLMRTGSVVLHELYFANLGGNSRPSAETRAELSRAFVSFDAWETEFRKIGLGLSGGSGWVVLGYNVQLKALENYWLADHGHHPADTRPVLVLDMYEHAYHMDYGAAAAKYVDAFFANIQWEVVAARLAASA